MGSESGGDFYALPESCIANALSFLGPREAGRLSVVSSTFNSAAESDAVWERFLPDDYRTIISKSSDSSQLLSSCSSKKQLYLSLCRNPILIDDGKKSFSLDKWSGKKCYMLSARDLMIVWGDTPAYWRWTFEPESRFSEVAELISVCWLEIRGKISTRMLSPATMYAAYLVFNSTTVAYGFDYQPVEVTVGLTGSESGVRTVYLDAEWERRQRYQIVPRPIGLLNSSHNLGLPQSVTTGESDGPCPKARGDGWLELELGEFFNKEGQDGELEMSVLEVKGGDWKGGLIVLGIQIRPKEGQ